MSEKPSISKPLYKQALGRANRAEKTGYYILNKRFKPTGANRVDFQINGDRVNVNFAGWRKAKPGEIYEILRLESESSHIPPYIRIRKALKDLNMSDTRAAKILGVPVRLFRYMKDGQQAINPGAIVTLAAAAPSDGSETGCRVKFPLDWSWFRCIEWLEERGFDVSSDNLSMPGNCMVAEFQP